MSGNLFDSLLTRNTGAEPAAKNWGMMSNRSTEKTTPPLYFRSLGDAQAFLVALPMVELADGIARAKRS